MPHDHPYPCREAHVKTAKERRQRPCVQFLGSIWGCSRRSDSPAHEAEVTEGVKRGGKSVLERSKSRLKVLQEERAR